jgi:hypothetical protein
MLAVVGVQHGAAAGRQHQPVPGGELGDDLLLALAEAGLAFLLEDEGDVHAGALLDLVVGVGERHAAQLGQPPAHGGLARAHGADQEDVGT